MTPFMKSVLDSLHANQFNASISLAFATSQDGISSLVAYSDAALMYSNRRSNYSISENNSRSLYDGLSTSNHLYVLASGDVFSHDIKDSQLVEKNSTHSHLCTLCMILTAVSIIV
jgi:hypothetical protein